MMRIGCTLAFALALAPALARADDKGMTKPKPTEAEARPDAAPGMKMPGTEAPPAEQQMTDARLITLLHRVNQEEIAAGKLAQKKGSSAEVKDYGKKLIADHTRSNQEVMATAKKAGITPNDSELTAHDQEMMRVDKKKMDELKRLSGTEFDRAFTQELSRDHDHMISMLRDSKKQLSAPVRELVDNTIPVMEQHKDLADKAAKSADRGVRGRTPQPVKR
jgi:putative membrane protein